MTSKMMKNKRWKRLGKCKRCGMCCRYGNIMRETDKELETLGRRSYLLSKGALIKRTNKTNNVIGVPTPCIHYYEKNGLSGCYLHGTFFQPEMCRTWPSCPEPYYIGINRFKKCGYTFVEDK